MYFINISM